MENKDRQELFNAKEEKYLKEYFQKREDGGAFFNLNNESDLCDFESFLNENGYSSYLNKKIVEAEEITAPTDSPKPEEPEAPKVSGEEIKNRYKEFFLITPSQDDFDYIFNKVTEYRNQFNSYNLLTAIEFLKRPENAGLLNYEKNQIGQGEFAFYILIPTSKKIAATSEKGDIRIDGQSYEIKRLKTGQSLIRFGTTLDLQTIKDFNFTLYGVQKLLNSKEYKDGKIIEQFKLELDKIIAFKPKSKDIDAGSINSWEERFIF
jgi:hypothetical protein